MVYVRSLVWRTQSKLELLISVLAAVTDRDFQVSKCVMCQFLTKNVNASFLESLN